MTLLWSEGLAWERIQQVVSEEDVAICYDMFVKEFERSTVHDLFKVFFFSSLIIQKLKYSSTCLTSISFYTGYD